MNFTTDNLNQIDTMINGSKTMTSAKLVLNITDQNTITYLNQFDDDTVESKALEALKIGVIAIESATPTIDTNLVRKRFGELVTNMDDCFDGFNTDVKQELDKIFGVDNFRNEIIWYYSTLGRPDDRFAQKHDTIYCYGKSENTFF